MTPHSGQWRGISDTASKDVTSRLACALELHRVTPRWPAGFPALAGACQFGTLGEFTTKFIRSFIRHHAWYLRHKRHLPCPIGHGDNRKPGKKNRRPGLYPQPQLRATSGYCGQWLYRSWNAGAVMFFTARAVAPELDRGWLALHFRGQPRRWNGFFVIAFSPETFYAGSCEIALNSTTRRHPRLGLVAIGGGITRSGANPHPGPLPLGR